MIEQNQKKQEITERITDEEALEVASRARYNMTYSGYRNTRLQGTFKDKVIVELHRSHDSDRKLDQIWLTLYHQNQTVYNRLHKQGYFPFRRVLTLFKKLESTCKDEETHTQAFYESTEDLRRLLRQP